MNSMDNFDEIELPSIDKFYSSLQKNILVIKIMLMQKKYGMFGI